MSESSARASEPAPDCPKCGRPMVRRTARRGANVGSEFWGCSEFPRCRGIVQDQPPVDAPADADASAPVQRAQDSAKDASVPVEEAQDNDEDASVPVQGSQDSADEASGPDAGDKPRGFLTRVVQTIDKGHRWYLERDEPDATGRWDADHRRRMLSYVHTRDGGRCGLCAGETKQKGAQIEHIVPKVFAVFDVGKGRQGRAGHPVQEPPAQDRQPAGRPHLLQQAQGQHPRGRQVAAPGNATAHRRGRRRRRNPRAAPGVEGSISALTPGNRQHR